MMQLSLLDALVLWYHCQGLSGNSHNDVTFQLVRLLWRHSRRRAAMSQTARKAPNQVNSLHQLWIIKPPKCKDNLNWDMQLNENTEMCPLCGSLCPQHGRKWPQLKVTLPFKSILMHVWPNKNGIYLIVTTPLK